MPSIFLSHSSKDKFFVRELAERLVSHGITVWIDEAEIKVGDSLTERIGSAIRENDFVGVVLSTNSIDSEWVRRELQEAMQREFREKRVVVLPLLIEPVTPPPFLADKLYADFTDPKLFGQALARLLKALGVTTNVDLGAAAPAEAPPTRSMQSTRNAPALDTARDLETFDDVQIADIDMERSYKPDAHMALYNMFLRLSNNPPSDWTAIFDAERRFPRHTMWRKAWIDGRFIILNCVPDELEKYHLADLRQDVANANRKYREYLTELARKERRAAEQDRNEKDDLANLKRRLGFG